MKRILNGVGKVSLVIFVVTGHYMFWRWLAGNTFAVIYTVIQILIGLWMVYELIRAPVYDD